MKNYAIFLVVFFILNAETYFYFTVSFYFDLFLFIPFSSPLVV